MTDRSKVINYFEDELSKIKPVDWWVTVRKDFLSDALTLLKEHEPIEPDIDSEGTCTCGNCGDTIGWYPVGCHIPNKFCKFCPNCGKQVKWDERDDENHTKTDKRV